MNLTPPQVKQTTKTSTGVSRFSTGEIVMLIIFIVLVGWYLIKPKYSELGKRKVELAQVEADKKKLQDTEDLIVKLHSDLQKAENKDSITLLDEAVPLESRTTRIYILLENLVKNSGMALGSMSIEPLTSLGSPGTAGSKVPVFEGNRKLATYTISLNLTGGMQQFNDLLKILENNPRLFETTSIDIGGQDSSQLSIKLVVNSFAYGK